MPTAPGERGSELGGVVVTVAHSCHDAHAARSLHPRQDTPLFLLCRSVHRAYQFLPLDACALLSSLCFPASPDLRPTSCLCGTLDTQRIPTGPHASPILSVLVCCCPGGIKCKFVQALLPSVRSSHPIPPSLPLPLLHYAHRQSSWIKFSCTYTPAFSFAGVGVDLRSVNKPARVLDWALHTFDLKRYYCHKLDSRYVSPFLFRIDYTPRSHFA